jgi:hypothetical protein
VFIGSSTKTPTPTTTPTTNPKGGNFTYENLANEKPLSLPKFLSDETNITREDDLQTTNPKNQFFLRSMPYILGIILLLAMFGFGTYKIRKYVSNKTPHILPPTNI